MQVSVCGQRRKDEEGRLNSKAEDSGPRGLGTRKELGCEGEKLGTSFYPFKQLPCSPWQPELTLWIEVTMLSPHHVVG